MVYNAPNHKLYFVVSDMTAPDGGSGGDTGIFTLNIAADGTASNLNRLVSWGGASGIQNPYGIAIDNTNSLLFITDFGNSHNTGQTFNPRIEVANLNTGVILNSSLQFINASAPDPNFFHYYWAVDVNPATDTLYWTMAGPDAAANNQILTATYTTGAIPTLGTVKALYTASSAGPLPEAMAIDVANGVYYVALSSSVNFNGSIVEGSLSTANGTQTTIYTLPTNTQPDAILFEAAPVLTAGATVGYTEQGTAATLDSNLTVADSDGAVASATVSITAGFLTGDTLNFTNQNGITGSYNSGTGVLSLTGSATVADYQTALRSITFSSTSDNPTSFGAEYQPHHQLDVERRHLEQHDRHQHRECHRGRRRPRRDGRHDGELHRAGYGHHTRLDPDAERCRQHEPGGSHGGDQRRLPLRRRAQLHQPERHHRQLQRQHRRTHPHRQRVAGHLPDGAAVDHFSSASDNPTSFGTDTSRTIACRSSDGSLNSASATAP